MQIRIPWMIVDYLWYLGTVIGHSCLPSGTVLLSYVLLS